MSPYAEDQRSGPGNLRGVGKTALGVAIVRARESQRDGRLFDDPYAQAFVDAAPGTFPEEPTSAAERDALGPLAELGGRDVLRPRSYPHALLR